MMKKILFWSRHWTRPLPPPPSPSPPLLPLLRPLLPPPCQIKEWKIKRKLSFNLFKLKILEQGSGLGAGFRQKAVSSGTGAWIHISQSSGYYTERQTCSSNAKKVSDVFWRWICAVSRVTDFEHLHLTRAVTADHFTSHEPLRSQFDGSMKDYKYWMFLSIQDVTIKMLSVCNCNLSCSLSVF